MPTLLLMNRSFDVIGKISRYDNWNISLVGNGMDEISFDVHKYADGKLCPVWDDLIDLKIIDVSGFGRFEISVDYTDNTETVKSVHGFSLETELAQIRLYEFHINDDEAADMNVTDYSSDYVDGKFIPTTFYNPDDKKHSLLHRVLADKAPHWSIGYVTKHIALDEESQPELASEFQRTYTVDGDSIYDFLTGTVSEESNVIFVFDTIHRIINCYSLCDCIDQTTGEVMRTGIGEDTTVFVSKNKLANEITISSNKDNVKNCFRVEGGDDVISDMVRAVNMNGSNYIFQFADFQYNDMPVRLMGKIKAYQIMMSSKGTQDAYYGDGDIGNFINGSLALRVTSELEAASILNICKNNKVKTNGISVYSYKNYKYYWNIIHTDGSATLQAAENVIRPFKHAKSAINSMGIYKRLCNAYDILGYFESSMMPNTEMVTEPGTAKDQYDKIIEELKKSPVAVSSMNNYNNNLFVGVTNNIEAYAQIFLDSRFDLEIVDGTTSYSYTDGAETGTWKGKIRIIQHTDETNVYPVDIPAAVPIEVTVNADELEFAKQKVEKALSKGSMLDIDFEVENMNTTGMREYFSKYSLNRLKSFYDGYNSCISVLMELGQATTKNGTDSPVRVNIYDKYKQRLDIVEEVYKHRQENVDDANKLIDDIQQEQNAFIYGDSEKNIPPHDFKTYIGDDLYVKFCAYRREDTYKNDNYVSDGLSTSECLAKAKELIEAATKEAKKACVLQRTVSVSLNNLFALPEFEPLYEKFAMFNYIRIRTEDEILKLRIIGIEFSGDSVEEIQVTFSEQIESIDGKMNDLQSIIQQAGNMATSYSSTVLQAKQGSEAQSTISDIYTNGLNAAKTMLTNNDNNEITITPSGIICRRMDDEGFYGNKQIRITGNIMAFTDDAWETVKTAIGEITFYNPESKKFETRYGIVADAVVGNLIVGNNMFIGNQNGSVQITGSGIKITNGTITWGNGENSVNAPEMGDIDGLEGSIGDLSGSLSGIRNNFTKFQTDVKSVLGLGSTTITSSTVIAPKIGGGYLFITDGRTINNTGISVEINPSGTGFTGHNGNYVFNISKKNNDNTTDLIMGVTNGGNGYFSGNIKAKTGKIANFNISEDKLCTDEAGFNDGSGIYFGTEGLRIGNSFKIRTNGNGYFSGEIKTESGKIGGWDINTDSISYGNLNGNNYIKLDAFNSCIESKSGSFSAELSSGNLIFKKDNHNYVNIFSTFWKDKPSIYGVGINSEADSKFIAFGNKNSSTESSYDSSLVLNYGLNPNEHKQKVLIYGSTLITDDVTFYGNLNINKNIKATDQLQLISNYGKIIMAASGNNKAFRPTSEYDGDIILGSSGCRWKEIWCTQSSINSSDRNLKNSIHHMDEQDQLEKLFLSLLPCTYKFNNGESGRTHFGFISQDVEQALLDNGMTSLDFAGFCKDLIEENGTEKYSYSLRYGEFIALNTHMIQKLYKRIEKQQEEINWLKREVKKLI